MKQLLPTLAMGIAMAVSGPVVAGPYVPPSDPIDLLKVNLPAPAGTPPDGPWRHPGKEYSHEFDEDAARHIDSQQNVKWDGHGGVADTFDYNDSDGADPGAPAAPDGNNNANDQVDAIANVEDALYTAVISDQTPLLFSTRKQEPINPNTQGLGRDAGLPTPPPGSSGGCAPGDPVCYETNGISLIGTWATPPQVSQHGVDNLDGLEVWGADGTGAGTDDANRYSLFNDFAHGTSIYNYVGATGVSSTYLTQAALTAAVVPFLASETGITFNNELIDIDALMVHEGGGSLSAFDAVGDSILFSLWPIFQTGGALPDLVGDHAIVWNFGTAPTWLVHGGHTWNDGWIGDPTINVDALEAAAVPAPAPLALVVLGLMGLVGKQARQRSQ